MADPKLRSYWLYLLENRLVGLDEPLAQARRTGAFDYDAPIEGLQVVDRYTLRLRFRDPDYAFQHWLTTMLLRRRRARGRRRRRRTNPTA